jgi:N-acetylglucosaminyldiphosphoundecaprenol N-acetyl-beta-D-mannosaminyltransferase
METGIEADVLGVRIRRRSRRETLQCLRELLDSGSSHSVYFVNAAAANLAFEDPRFRAVLNRGSLVCNDGIGVKLAARSRGVTLRDNLVGTDLVPLLLAEPFSRPLKIYLLGGRPGVTGRAASRIAERFPRVRVVGFSNGYFGPSRETQIVKEIGALGPDLLLAGMGNPRQEFFIDHYLPRLRCRVAMGVGGLLDHFAGELRRAPVWVRRLGCEWVQLLLQQPHKWRRYLLGNPKFLWRVYFAGDP